VVLYGIAVVLTGVLQAHRRFAGPALAPLLSSVVVAGAYLTFAGMGGDEDATGLSTPAELVLGVGTTLGVVALSLSLLLPLRGLRLGLRPTLRFPVGAAPRVRRLAVAGVLTLAGQQLVSAVAIRVADDGAPTGTLVAYTAGLTVFLLPWAALAVPLATSAYPGLVERADTGDEPGYQRALAPVVVLTVTATAIAAAAVAAAAGPLARVFLAAGSTAQVAALRDAIVAFMPGLLGYGLVALLTRALYARGLWKAPTVCVLGGWLVAVGADLLLAVLLPAEDRALALAAGHSIGVTVAGAGLLLVVARVSGRAALRGLGRAGVPALAAAALGVVAGLAVARALDADPVPEGSLLGTLLAGVLVGGTVLVVGGAVMMGAARGQLTRAVRELRSSGEQEVRGG
jgi:putative peptidoglycan lipid II flippase